MPKNVVVAQSGGPTPVINNTLRGLLDTCQAMPEKFGTVYAGYHGIEGVLKDELLTLSDQPAEEIALLSVTPAAGMTTNKTFAAVEVMLPFECNVHGWMHAFVGVLPHPFFASTGADGSFSITGLPAGTYTIEAWHEKYGAQTATVTVTGSDTKTSDFTFTAK